MDLNQDTALKEKLTTSATVAALLALTLFLFGPVQIYLPNSGLFPYMFGKVLWKFLPAALIALIGIFAVIALLPNTFKLHRTVVALVVGVAALLWLQGNVILWNYGVLDGRDIQWSALRLRGVIDGLIWLVVIAGVLIKRDLVYNLAKKICFFLIIIQLLYSVLLIFQYPGALKTKHFTMLDDSEQFNFSKKKNVIVMIVDGFQSDLFQQTANREEFKNVFDGFTYYRNSLAGFPLTRASVPYILTGKQYDNTIPFNEFVETVYFTDSSLPFILKQRGFWVDILMDCGRCFIKDKSLISNLKEDTVPLTNGQAGYLFDLTLFKYLPHFAKQKVFNNQRWRFARYLKTGSNPKLDMMSRLTNPVTGKLFAKEALLELFDVKFLAAMMAEKKVQREMPGFKFFHLKGVHAPFRMDENLNYKEMTVTRPNWETLARGAVSLLDVFIKQLKELGIYDDTMIVFVGDHGHSLGQFGMGLLPGREEEAQQEGPVPRGIMGSGIPMILVKRFGETGPMKISDSPVSLADVPNTVLTELGISGEFTGTAMFQVDPADTRSRWFNYFVWDQGSAVGKFFPPMTRYEVNGHSWLPGSWQKVDK